MRVVLVVLGLYLVDIDQLCASDKFSKLPPVLAQLCYEKPWDDDCNRLAKHLSGDYKKEPEYFKLSKAEKQKINQIRQMQELVDIMLRRAITRKDEGQLREMSKRISAFYLKEIFPQKIDDFQY